LSITPSLVKLPASSTEGGAYGQRLDGLNVVALAELEGNIWAGEASPAMGMYMDDRADEGRGKRSRCSSGGEAGGWPGDFAKMVVDVRGRRLGPRR